MATYVEIIIFIAGFSVVALASKQIGEFFIKANLPLISGFLFTGIIAGPYVLGLIPENATDHLRFVDEIALAFIAFAAGSELYLKELRSRFKSIRWVTIGLVVSTFTAGSLAVFLLADFIPFMRTMSATHRIAVSILAGAILVARSPSSAIAVVNELRAKGPFTQTALGVTVIMDVVVITLFAVNSSVADALFTGLGFDLGFLALLLAELSISIALGLLLSKLLQVILASNIGAPIKTGMILSAGYGVFLLFEMVRTQSHALLPVEVTLEPLLICMVAGFHATNFSKYRSEFMKILHDVGLPIYVAFFTLTGASLALSILAITWPIALTLFAVRLAGIFIGSTTGGVISGDPMSHNRISWMAYITQAGVGLGLAKQVVVEFPDWGTAFATIIISVIVLNQIVGPPFFKWAIHLVGEAHTRAETPAFDGVRDVIIFGLEGQSLALARQLNSHGWQVKIASRKASTIEERELETNIQICPIEGLTLDALHQLDAGQAEAIVAMLSDDENYQICELAYEHFGTENLVVRLHDLSNLERFRQLDAAIVEPTNAIVSLLDHFVRSPSATSLLLGMTENQDMVEVEVRNPDLHGAAIRDLRLPLDVQILSVRRRDQTLISHGYTRLEVGDWVSAIGSVASLERLMLRFDTDREHELVHLVERATPKELATRSLETEVQNIIRERGALLRDRFDDLVEQATVLDIPRAMDAKAFFKLAAETLQPRLHVKREIIYDLLLERERESSTALSPGLAIPHIIIEGERCFSLLLARCKAGIHFSEIAPAVHAVFVLVGTRDERNFHLRALSAIAQVVQDSHFENKWLRARSEKALRNVVLSAERKRQA